MINTAELGSRPVRERDLLPIAADEQAIGFFQNQIEYCRIPDVSAIHGNHFGAMAPLLDMSGEEEFSIIEADFDYRLLRYPRKKVEKGHAQELLLKVMTAYGFDETKTYERDNITVNPDGTTTEIIIYPSQTIEQLMFQRTRDFVTETGQTAHVRWHAREHASALKVDILGMFRRNPKPQIIQEEQKPQREIEKLCRELRSESEQLLDQYGARTPIFGRDNLSGKDLTAFAAELATSTSAILFTGVTPLQAIDRKELKTTLNENEEDTVEVRIISTNAVPQKSPDIRIYVQGINEHLSLLKGGIGFICSSGSRRITLNEATQYREVIDRVRDKFEPPTQPPQSH